MLRDCEYPDLMPLMNGLPDLPGTALVLTPIWDCREQLFDEERAALESMAERRQEEFSSGRYCVHRCQELLSLNPEPILRKERSPVWPSTTYTGSISHCDIVAVAAITTEKSGIGIDIERTNRVTERLFATLFTQSERTDFADLPSIAPAIAFSAKESGYKAIFPTGGQFIGFQEAAVKLNWPTQTFTIAYFGTHEPNRALHLGEGYWQVRENYVLTIFVIN